jgi:hypothetical protein
MSCLSGCDAPVKLEEEKNLILFKSCNGLKKLKCDALCSLDQHTSFGNLSDNM